MTSIIKRYLSAVMLATALYGCHDAPYIPSGELYMRSFIKEFGLIDPEQEWNLAETMYVTVDPLGPSSVIQVYVRCGVNYYRVALYANIDQMVTIPFDAPAGTEDVVVDFDGVRYRTTPGGVVYNYMTGSEERYSRTDANPSGNVLMVTNTGLSDLSYSPQLNLALTGELPAGTYVFEGDIKADVPWQLEARIQQKVAPWGGTNFPRINVTTSWTHFSVEVTTTMALQNLLFQINTYVDAKKQANTYYFDNLSLKAQGSATELISDGTDFSAYTYALWGESTLGTVRVITYDTGSCDDFYSVGDLGWLMVAEDLGATDDIDFNDVIFKIEHLSTNLTLQDKNWTVSDNEVVIKPSAPARESRSIYSDGHEYVQLSRDAALYYTGGVKITAMAAGGTIPVYLHYWNQAQKKDYVIGPQYINQTPVFSEAIYEWHYWFTDKPHIGDWFSEKVDSKYAQIKTDNTFVMINTDTEYWGRTYEGEYQVMAYSTNRATSLNSQMNDNSINWSQIIDGAEVLDRTFPIRTGNLSSAVIGESFLISQASVVNVEEGYNWADIQSGFYISVGGNTTGESHVQFNANSDVTVIGLTEKGRAPQMFMIPDVGIDMNGWAWPSERTHIKYAYESFTDWIKKDDKYWYQKAPRPHNDLDGDYHGTGIVTRTRFTP